MLLAGRPTIYEINTAVWLEQLGHGVPLRLDEVPGEAWDEIASLPVDAVWLMGVWQRSPAGLQIALSNPEITRANGAALPDVQPNDVIGSPYCVRAYEVDPRFGGDDALAAARAALAQRRLGLILDYVPNHVAPDHPWTVAHPDYFVAGDESDLAAHPDAFVRAGAAILANGRDPYFAPWPDVVQLNAFSAALRDAVAATLTAIGDRCDGVRCDMAMLMANDVFARTWGERVGPAPEDDYWPSVIARVRERHPSQLFMAEVYWDMEWELQQQGFDLCYDKRLYDRLRAGEPAQVRGHLRAERSYQERLLRFIENHDEPRAAATFPGASARTAAVAMSTLQGARLYYDGQLTGRHVHVPVFLARAPEETDDEELHDFYRRLLRAVAESELHDAEWTLCDCTGWPDNESAEQLAAWSWSTPRARQLVVVNLAPAPAQARVRLPWEDLAAREWSLQDRLSGAEFQRAGDELAATGLYVALDGWGTHMLSFAARAASHDAG